MKKFAPKELRAWLPKRGSAAHKGDFGHVLVVAGSRGMTGAAVLAARGALRAGCGLVTVAVPESQQPIVASHLTEAMTALLPETPAGAIRAEAAGRVQALHRERKFSVLALGPGLTAQSDPARAVVGLLAGLPIPAVIDADALNSLAAQPRESIATLLRSRAAPYVLTPHPGEISRLLRIKIPIEPKERREAAERLCATLGGVCLLKGRETVVTDGERWGINSTGNSGLAKGGTGDALTGIIAGLWSQRLSARRAGPADNGFEAAALGAFLHGRAADVAAREKTEYSLLASDVIESLPLALRALL